jgi:hypothetical protein
MRYERYEFVSVPWTGILGTFPTTQGILVPKEGVWFWADFPERRPYVRKARR